MKSRLVTTLAVALTFVLLGSFLVSALVDDGIASQEVSKLTVFLNNILHFSQKFSVVGDSRSCGTSGGNANYAWSVDSGKKLDGSEGVLTGTAHSIPANSLINIFTNGWTPFLEVKDFNTWVGCGIGPCNIQVYVCPQAECTSNSCGVGKTCNQVSCELWPGRTTSKGTPITAYRCPTESGIPYYTNSYSYCSVSDTMKCYYKDGNDCGSRLYDKSLFPNQCEFYTYQTQKLYTDYNVCKSTICIPNNCASTTCIGQTCSDGCGRTIQGIKDCVTPTPPTTPTCSDGIQNQGEEGIDCGGPCSACDNGEEPSKLGAVIYDISYPSSVETGKEIKVEFKVKNNGDTGDYLIEIGVIPKKTATDWGFSFTGDQLFSIWDWFNVKYNTECCEGQPNIFANTANLKSGETDEFLIRIPNVPYEGIRDLCYDNSYWDGTGEYVLYLTVKTGCYPDGKEVAYETRILTITPKAIVDENGDGITDEVEEGIITKNSFNQGEIIDLTSSQLKNALCKYKDECPGNSSCERISKMIDNDDMEDQQSENLRDVFCIESSIFSLFTDVDVASSCTKLTGKQAYFDSNFGICTIKEEGFDFNAWIKKIGKSVKITDNDTLNGYIILIGGLFLLFMFLNLIGGKK